MWHKTEWMRLTMRLELTLAGLLVKLANHYTIWIAHRDLKVTVLIKYLTTRIKKVVLKFILFDVKAIWDHCQEMFYLFIFVWFYYCCDIIQCFFNTRNYLTVCKNGTIGITKKYKKFVKIKLLVWLMFKTTSLGANEGELLNNIFSVI